LALLFLLKLAAGLKKKQEEYCPSCR